MQYRKPALASLLVLTLLGSLGAASAGAGPGEIRRVDRPIRGHYVVVLRDSSAGARGPASRAPEIARQLAERHRGRVAQVYRHALHGFAIEADEDAALRIASDPRVAFVQEDLERNIEDRPVVASATLVSQRDAPWGLDRIDQRALPLDGRYGYASAITGAGVTAFVIDTGIRASHVDFEGRASVGTDTVGDGGGGHDCHGHGTHVAATIGGAISGVAKGVKLVAVRVMNCNGAGSDSSVIAGVEWVTAHHAGPSVANMSIGGPRSDALDQAVQASIDAGVTYAVAAGNDGKDACDGSPAHLPGAITVGAVGDGDAVPAFSNYGACVDLYAPGVGIASAWYTSDTAAKLLSGTSMASPHVAGAAALLLQTAPRATPAQIAAELRDRATTGRLSGLKPGSPDRLLYVHPARASTAAPGSF